jgi:tetratricopeptide (TPR) repeat protein
VVAAGTTPLAARNEAEAFGPLSVALAHARRLLDTRPALAEQQAREILRAVPDQPDALLILAVAKRRNGDPGASRADLTRLVGLQPRSADAHYELGLTEAALGHAAEAKRALRRATELRPLMSDAWRALGDQHGLAGDMQAADAAYAHQIRTSVTNPALIDAAAALGENRLAVAERLLKDFLKRYPTDVAAMRMLAELATRIGRYQDAQALLERCLELAPSFAPARHNHAVVLYRLGNAARAVEEIDRLLAVEPGDPNYRNLKAAALSQIGDYDRAITLYAGVLAEYPDQPKVWMSYGHGLKTKGRRDKSIAAYRRAIALKPDFGEAWWSLANLKTFRFGPQDAAAMRSQLARPELADDDRLHFHFALGKALEDEGAYDQAFREYAEGNRIRRGQVEYDADEMSDQIRRSMAVFTPEFLARHAGTGCAAADPIFIVGLPRSGSTLIEQILSSHSAVEGTMELPEISAMARVLGGRRRKTDPSLYPEILADLDPARLRAMGEQYLADTRIQRKTARPFFIDKMPHNFLHVGLISLILPNARIIDARRHPMATCFSAFKQHFARGQAFSHDLGELGRYYRDYVALMAHFDQVMPGKIHRVQHEALVDDPESEIRRLLAWCGLDFEAGCLSFHENTRAVRTASSEQVRRPISREGLDHWRHYEPWLGPLAEALGDLAPVHEEYPNA